MSEKEEEEFAPPRPVNRFRRAWCELTGGHKSKVMGTWMTHERPSRATQVSLFCTKCGRTTRWFDVPYSKATK